MVTLWREVLKPGTYRLPGGRTVTFTRRDVRNAEATGGAMLEDGLGVPLVWEHQAAAVPVYLSDFTPASPDWPADFARHTFGRVTGYRVNARGALEAKHEIPDPAEAERFKGLLGVSPRLDVDFVDERGKLWPGVTVSHVAATPKPVQRDLAPPTLLSQTAGRGRSRSTVFLSFATREGSAVAKDDDEKDDAELESDAELPPDDAAAADPEPALTPAPMNLTELVGLLGQCGVMVGEGVADLNDLVSRLKAVVAMKAGGDSGTGDDYAATAGAGADAAGGTRPGGGPPAVMMSHTRLPARIVAGDRRELARRADELFRTGRVDGATHRRLLAEAKAVDLSYTPAGEIAPHKLVHQLEAYEGLPAGCANALTGAGGKAAALSQTRAAARPAELAGPNSPEAIEEARKAISRFCTYGDKK